MELPLSIHDEKSLLIFKALFESHYKSMLFFAQQILSNRDLAEDLVQDAFINYWNQREIVPNEVKAIKSYLYSTVKFMALNHIRHQKVVDNYAAAIAVAGLCEEEITVKLIRAEVLNELYLALQSLPESCREVFRLGYFEGFNNAKIAEMMQVSINTVKTHKQRGLKTLRTILRPETFLLLTLLF
jgi:RNA polymerase sigma-70 factor (ECF subfamily)